MPDEITLDLRPNAFDVTEPEIDMYLDIAKESDETIKTFKALATDSHLTGEMFSEYYTKELIKYVLDKRLLDPDTPIKEQDLLALHGFLYAMEFTEAGRLRKVDVVVFGSHGKQPPSYEMVPVLFKKFCVWLNSSSSKALSPEDLAFRAADRLVKLHPFVDANGRSARLLANLILLRHKCVPMAAHALKGKSITITLMRKAQSEYKRTKEEQEKWAMRRVKQLREKERPPKEKISAELQAEMERLLEAGAMSACPRVAYTSAFVGIFKPGYEETDSALAGKFLFHPTLRGAVNMAKRLLPAIAAGEIEFIKFAYAPWQQGYDRSVVAVYCVDKDLWVLSTLLKYGLEPEEWKYNRETLFGELPEGKTGDISCALKQAAVLGSGV